MRSRGGGHRRGHRSDSAGLALAIARYSRQDSIGEGSLAALAGELGGAQAGGDGGVELPDLGIGHRKGIDTLDA